MRQWHSGDCASLTRRYHHRFESCLAHHFMIAAAAAALAGLHHDDDRKGGRGQCRHCGEWENNVSYHEAWECPKRVQEAPQWLKERMERLKNLPAPTLEEVKTQLEASAKSYNEQSKTR